MSAEPIICPRCKGRRPDGDDLKAGIEAFTKAMPNGRASTPRRTSRSATRAASGRSAAYQCCNKACRGKWGTNCYHCHHPSYWQGKASVDAELAYVQRGARLERQAEADQDDPFGGAL